MQVHASILGAVMIVSAFLVHPLEAGEVAAQTRTHEPRNATRGPLRVHPKNPRYFADRGGKLVFLTGSHTWGNLQDYTYASKRSPAPMNFADYLKFLISHNHNFIRLWTWESPVNRNASQSTITYQPMPYDRPGPGLGADGKPRFDLRRFNQVYFDRLRNRVAEARDQGVYVAVMLFQGFSIEGKGNVGGDPWRGHPFHPGNNVNGIDGGGRLLHTLANRAVTDLQEAYVRKVIDTVNDLNNVLYEISNEDRGGLADTDWQYHMIRFIHRVLGVERLVHGIGSPLNYLDSAGPSPIRSTTLIRSLCDHEQESVSQAGR
ncbi:MAG: DUF6298 domain-containing protein, partial [Chloroflexi bacterium]|nr:DUF6298 domain-containing protein [Chloroflexota bacterium]